MSFNYRVLEFHGILDEPWFAVHEVFYTDDGVPYAYADKAAVISGDTVEELQTLVDRLNRALSEPVLKSEIFEASD